LLVSASFVSLPSVLRNDRFVLNLLFYIYWISSWFVAFIDRPSAIANSTHVPPETNDEENEQLEGKSSQVDKAAAGGSTEEIAGVVDWCRPSGVAFGAATSLYERNPTTGETAGNPVADVNHNVQLDCNYLFVVLAFNLLSL